MAYSKEPVIKLTPADIETVRATCREVHGYKDYWVDEYGKNLYFILSRPINSMGRQIFSRKVPISKSNGYLGATLVLYESMGFYIEFPGPTEDTLLCSREVKRMHMAVIVALAWIGPKPDPSLDARHLDGNKDHNHHSISLGDREKTTAWIPNGTTKSVVESRNRYALNAEKPHHNQARYAREDVESGRVARQNPPSFFLLDTTPLTGNTPVSACQ